ncbi:dethiobiotin synthase [Zeaxanthinibacter sp. PT1]|uniref:dethiobiotin synthase n=1 Tax=Zeaxanthinibacter TaxID=561554 RepID=UPI00234B6472|nr:dethiobiotin synthase [Zeaxanthinibacter sp. PT1]MDC6351062.1 dethiobiotin synthase [Zeaxanthinibacter sp. PT1]
MKRIFVTGISTEVGKTVAAAIITEALKADYWKPIQAGDLDSSDSHRIRSLVSNPKTVIHPNAYALKSPMSPHAAAAKDGLYINLADIYEPETDNTLVIEGAGGILVPINDEDTILDLIKPHYNVVVVSRHYLGSINHSLLTLYQLQQRGFRPAIMFSGAEHPSTEEIILKKSGATYLGRIDEESGFDKDKISFYADRFRPALEAL